MDYKNKGFSQKVQNPASSHVRKNEEKKSFFFPQQILRREDVIVEKIIFLAPRIVCKWPLKMAPEMSIELELHGG